MCVKEISLASFSPSNKVVNCMDSSLPENKIKDKKIPLRAIREWIKQHGMRGKKAKNKDLKTLAVLTRQSENGISLHSFIPIKMCLFLPTDHIIWFFFLDDFLW